MILHFEDEELDGLFGAKVQGLHQPAKVSPCHPCLRHIDRHHAACPPALGCLLLLLLLETQPVTVEQDNFAKEWSYSGVLK
jgi:hypothetical protein